ncbi:MATE family efflux transporter [Cohnella suwonensis]|uniref:Probable multidrug resistance protein NorM n=1 Tax=Cohnella suwonensis TaxID=696072 RepID=A0ABW0LZI4_9BACL
MTIRKKEFYAQLYKLAIPIAVQSLVMSLLYLTDQLMVGQLGDAAIATVGMASKVYGVIGVVLSGLATGVSVFAAQYWGMRDREGVSKFLGLGLIVGTVLSLGFALLVFGFPEAILGAFTTDARVLDEGRSFIRIAAISYVPTMLTLLYSAIMRSTGHTKYPMVASIVVVGINVVLNYLLIFGHAGFPELGLEGSAIATLISKTIECALIIGAVYRYRLPGAVSPVRLFRVPRDIVSKFARTTYPIVLAELVWVLSEFAYSVIYSRMGTTEMTAMTLSFPLQGLSIGLLTGLSGAAAIMVGNKLGAGDKEEAYDIAVRCIRFGLWFSLAFGAVMAALSPFYVSLFNVSPEANRLGTYVIWVFAGFMWVKVSNMIIAGGILQSGGDGKFVFAMESIVTWAVGVPLGLLLSFVWKQPVFWVYFFLSLEEAVRLAFGLLRIRSRKWMKQLTA